MESLFVTFSVLIVKNKACYMRKITCADLEKNAFSLRRGAILFLVTYSCFVIAETKSTPVLEEVYVTAQKQTESLQNAPIAISAMSAMELEKQGISSLLDFREGAMPALKVAPFPSEPGTLQIGIRGVTQADSAQFTKEQAVGTYIDGVYVSRANSLAMETVDIQQIEVLRGARGTLYGRNAIGGAINITTVKPQIDTLSFRQTLGYGSWNYKKSQTRLNIPIGDNFAARLAYGTSSRDGWVENEGDDNWNQFDKLGWRVALRHDSEKFIVDYEHRETETEATQIYYQLHRIENEPTTGEKWLLNTPLEHERLDKARFNLPLDPALTETALDRFSIEWHGLENHTISYIGSKRDLDFKLSNNFGGIFFVGNVQVSDDTQSQETHEFQSVGSFFEEQFRYVAGIYNYSENVREDNQNLISVLPVDQQGIPLLGIQLPNAVSLPFAYLLPYSQRDQLPATGQLVLNSVIIPANGEMNGLLRAADQRIVEGEVNSNAAYLQMTWGPAWLFDGRLEITTGLRYTEDKKEYFRSKFNDQPDDTSRTIEGEKFTPSVTFNYFWSDSFSTWVRWGNGYRSGGVSLRSAPFIPYEADEIEEYEFGWKSQFWNDRVRVNGSVFALEWKNKQIDFSDPVNITVAETINANRGNPEHEGGELDIEAALSDTLRVSLNYQYLSVTQPPQFNPLSDGLEDFAPELAPSHSASLKFDYEKPVSFGVVGFNVSANYQDSFSYGAPDKTGTEKTTLFNAKIALREFAIGRSGEFDISLYVKNITDEEWATHNIQSSFSYARAYGDPRSYGVDVTYRWGE